MIAFVLFVFTLKFNLSQEGYIPNIESKCFGVVELWITFVGVFVCLFTLHFFCVCKFARAAVSKNRNWAAQTAEIYRLTILSKSPKSRCRQNGFLLRAGKENLIQASRHHSLLAVSMFARHSS